MNGYLNNNKVYNKEVHQYKDNFSWVHSVYRKLSWNKEHKGCNRYPNLVNSGTERMIKWSYYNFGYLISNAISAGTWSTSLISHDCHSQIQVKIWQVEGTFKLNFTGILNQFTSTNRDRRQCESWHKET